MPSGWALIQEPNRAIASYIGEKRRRFLRNAWINHWWLIDIVGPALLLIVLVWLVMRRGSTGKTGRTEQATDQLYREEEQRRREGTDAAED